MNQMTSWTPPLAGCAPSSCFDPSALLGCYSDIQALTTLITQIVQNLAATDPAFQKALVDAIVASGSNIPLVGVTNGSDAQPGQVGELIYMPFAMPFTTAQGQSQTVTFGVLPPGDWDYWAYGTATVFVDGLLFSMPVLPPGFNDPLWTDGGAVAGVTQATIVSGVGRALTTAPSLIVLTVQTNTGAPGTSAGTLELSFRARRRR